ncbi:hypothetical protein ACH5RR_034272 [Cinchona calisaya]|uniref:Coenzyme Q-binding protein COQ10 START domain-containing protein n=1 Tax=Cinchona calisaya TaxID=153742 RepID=A0ABD2YCK9_9GENT
MKSRYCGSHKYRTSIHTTPVPAPADLRFIAAATTSRITTGGGGGVCIGVCSISTGRWRRNPNRMTPMMSSYGYRRRRCRVPSRFCYPSSSSSDSYKDSGELSHSYDEDNVCAGDDDVEIWIEETGSNRRRIQSRVSVKASLQIVWNILTDYEKLADFIPGLAVSQVLQKTDSFARLFQIGQQDLAFGLKFKAKGVIDCYEKDLQNFPFGQRRDIEFNMIEGDFQLFQGKWSVEQVRWILMVNSTCHPSFPIAIETNPPSDGVCLEGRGGPGGGGGGCWQ